MDVGPSMVNKAPPQRIVRQPASGFLPKPSITALADKVIDAIGDRPWDPKGEVEKRGPAAVQLFGDFQNRARLAADLPVLKVQDRV